MKCPSKQRPWRPANDQLSRLLEHQNDDNGGQCPQPAVPIDRTGRQKVVHHRKVDDGCRERQLEELSNDQHQVVAVR